MRRRTAMLFWWFAAALVVWLGLAALSPGLRHGMMSGTSLLAGPDGWGAMHMWGVGPYVRSQNGGPPQSADVERALNRWLTAQGNPRLKLGPVTEKDASTFRADIVTKDGSLVQRFEIDRNSGRIAPVED